MSSPVTTAVILAAGLGSRLKEQTVEKPKAFIEIDRKPLIERSIDNLLGRGIKKIIIGTGYLNHFFDALKFKYPSVVTMRNIEFASTGSMYTLFTVRKLLDDSFLLLEGDLLYDVAALDYLLEDSREDIILGSDATHSGDEVYMQCSAEGYLQAMSKDKKSLAHADAELIGISKLSLQALQELVDFVEIEYRDGKKEMHYEDALVGIATRRNLSVKIVKGLAWSEIDDHNHLKRALEIVYPKILGRSNS